MWVSLLSEYNPLIEQLLMSHSDLHDAPNVSASSKHIIELNRVLLLHPVFNSGQVVWSGLRILFDSKPHW